MIAPAVQYSLEKQQALKEQLVGFWAEDVWDMTQCPLLTEPAPRVVKLRFLCTSPSLNTEMKYVYWKCFTNGDWSIISYFYQAQIHLLVVWLNDIRPDVSSFVDRSLEYWELSLRSYVAKNGKFSQYAAKKLDRSQTMHTYVKNDTRLTALRKIYAILLEVYDERPEREKDVWDCRKLGTRINPSKSRYYLTFTSLSQEWLRRAAKEYIWYNLSINSAANSENKLSSLRTFSMFLRTLPQEVCPSAIDRPLMLAYIGYLSSLDFVSATRKDYILNVRSFLAMCAREGWADVPDRPLLYRGDIPQPDIPKPRFIPQNVLDQLNAHLDALPSAVMRMVIIIQTCGMRIGELCIMPFDCLEQDANADWWLRYLQSKMKKEHRIPISKAIASVIQEQQQDVRETYGTNCSYLFLSASGNGHPMKQKYFGEVLNKLAYDYNICDSNGKLFRFQSHQFRHTVGTRMINSGVPHHIVQRYLGHESPEMTNRYAHLHDETMRKEFEKFAGTMITVEGKQTEVTAATADLEWFKRNILGQALPNGTCFLPTAAGPCPHANACLTCTHFRTDIRFLDQHHIQLVETRRLLEKARANNWTRQIEMNEQVERNLERIILVLESSNDPST